MQDYHLRPAKECPHCKGTGRFTIYWPDGSVCTDKAFCPHPDTSPEENNQMAAAIVAKEKVKSA